MNEGVPCKINHVNNRAKTAHATQLVDQHQKHAKKIKKFERFNVHFTSHLWSLVPF